MKYPKLRKPYEHRAELQNLSGGLNTYLPPHLISFNEQSEIENMFYYKGSLQKRPCFKKVSELEGYLVSNIETANGVFIYKHSIDEKGSGSFSSAFVTKEGNLITVADIPLSKEYEFESDLRGKTAYCFFPFYFNEILYLGIGFKDNYNGFMSKVYKFSQGEFILINDEEISWEKGFEYVTFEKLKNFFSDNGMSVEWQDYSIQHFSKSLDFNSADSRFLTCIEPIIDKISKQQLDKLMIGINENDQIYWRTRSKTDNTKIAKAVFQRFSLGKKYFSQYNAFNYDESVFDKVDEDIEF